MNTHQERKDTESQCGGPRSSKTKRVIAKLNRKRVVSLVLWSWAIIQSTCTIGKADTGAVFMSILFRYSCYLSMESYDQVCNAFQQLMYCSKSVRRNGGLIMSPRTSPT